MSLTRPNANEYPEYYGKYLSRIPADNIIDYLDNQKLEATAFLKTIDDKLLDFRYAPEKWNIREIISHISDTERIFASRALRISRGDTTPLPGFDQDTYVTASSSGNRDIDSLLEEFDTLRTANIALFEGFTEEQWIKRGRVNNYELTTRSIPFIIAGHLSHHILIIKERYLQL